jgi:hypothetical protein
MIIRIAQINREIASKDSYKFYTEIYNFESKKWESANSVYHYLKKAKVKHVNGIVYLAGTCIQDDSEQKKLQDFFFSGTSIDWNDDYTEYFYVEWLGCFDAYY